MVQKNIIDLMHRLDETISADTNETWVFNSGNTKLTFWANISAITGAGYDVKIQIPSESFNTGIDFATLGNIGAIGTFQFQVDITGLRYFRIVLTKIAGSITGSYGVTA